MRTRIRTSALALTALALAAGIPAACSSSEPAAPNAKGAEAATPRSTPEATALARALKERFPAAFPATTAPRTATVELPPTADHALRVVDDASRVGVAIALDGALPVEAAAAGDLVVYAAAAPSGGDLVHRALPSGVEDLVHYSKAPAREALTYHLDVHAAAGLRLVEGVLEVLDAGGVPVLRAEAPYVLDAAGRHEAALRVAGCAVDTSPRAPFGRAPIAPGSASCSVEVDWSRAGVRYPALVDPVWGTTFNVMGAARTRHTITLLNPTDVKSLALLAGGFSTTNGAPLKSAELYDPLSRRFSATGSMSVARGAHSATLLAPLILPPGLGPQLPVLVAGGADAGGSPIPDLDVYDPVSGVFVPDSHAMTAFPRFEHAAVPIGDAEVLLAGGISPPLNQPTNTAYVYSFSGFGAGSPPGSVASALTLLAATMTSPRTALTGTRLGTGAVLLAGGFVLAGNSLQALQTAEIFDPAASSFGPIQTAGSGIAPMSTQRGYHTATLLGASGTVLLVGGLSKTVSGNYTNTIDLYLDGSTGADKGFMPQALAITMATSRANHSATLLPDGRVLVAGGFSGASALGSAEVYSPTTHSFTDLGALVPMVARGDHAALLVNAGDSATAGHTVLVTGGATAPTVGAGALAGAQILLHVDGDPCTLADECLSGFCSDGVCCDAACTQECYACSAATKQGGPDGTCGFAKLGADPHYECLNELEVHTECDGNGSTQQDMLLTHDCKPGTCGASGLCSPGCTTTADCSLTGWCDLTQPSDAGPPGTCQPKKGAGEACDGDDRCKTGFCVDAVCCDGQCKEQCQACNLFGFVGKCQPVGSKDAPGDVHAGDLHPRVACDGFVNGQRTACTGACAGTVSVSVCQFPDATSFLGAPDCADDAMGGKSTLLQHPCDAKGGSTDQPGDCGDLRCADAHSCKTTCVADAECVADFACVAGACASLATPLCDGKDTLRQSQIGGGYLKCPDHYACPDGAHACLTACAAASDCVDGLVCNGDHKCIAEPSAPLLPSCAASPLPRATPWWLAGLVALLAVRRRRT